MQFCNHYYINPYENVETEKLIKIIKNDYHKYSSVTLKCLAGYSKEIIKKDRRFVAEKTMIADNISTLKDDAIEYIESKEKILFPFLLKYNSIKLSNGLGLLPLNTIQYTTKKFKNKIDDIIFKLNNLVNIFCRIHHCYEFAIMHLLLLELLEIFKNIKNIEEEILFLRLISAEKLSAQKII
jgi:iron-sulfur cluster repair protein YtfE (RIC family)